MKVFVIIALSLAIFLGVVFGLVIFFQRPPEAFERLEYQDMAMDVPKGSEVVPYEDRGWSGFTINEYGRIGFYLLPLSEEDDADETLNKWASTLSPITHRFDIELMDGGVFLLKAHGKNYRRYVYLFRAGDDLVWADMTSRSSTMLSFKKVLDRMVGSLRIGDRSISAEAVSTMEDIDAKIMAKSQSATLFALIGIGMYLLMMSIFGLVTWLSGRIPKRLTGRVLRSQKHAFVTVKAPFKSKGVFAAVVLTDAEFLVASFGKPIVRLPQDKFDIITLNRTSRKPRLEIEHDKKKIIVRVKQAEKWMRQMRKMAQGVS